MIPEISNRGHNMPASPIRKLASLADAAKQRGTHVHYLNIGQPDLETPEAIRRELAAIEDKVLCYSPSPGTPDFLAWMCEYYASAGISISVENVIATTGGSEAIIFAMMACADEGEEILVVEPFYTNYAAFAAMSGLRLVPVTSRGRDGFHLPSPAVWERALTPETRMVLLCNPNNPTGTVYSKDELMQVAEFCRRHDLFLVSDEVYREFVYDGRKAMSALELEGFEGLVIVVDSLSKRFSACGIRLGSLISRNGAIIKACMKMAQARLSASGIAQRIALGARNLPPDYTQTVISEYQMRRDILFEGLRSMPGVFLTRPEGAFYCVARLPVRDSDDFAEWLLRDFQHEGATILLAPAAGFYATPGLGMNEVRIAYVLDEKALRNALDVLRAGLAEYRSLRGLGEDELFDAPSAAHRS
ncbi:MAG TPA: pyridoxal phosphate-dependent aminotransferase [Thermoanaerobaculia bacterium]|nr:pyridoxal phosphate-dependent aminotransferase [Thermoanaerobaculia bacterium]